MWADNETDVDLLGFTYLADSLEIVLTEERLLPVTVGVMGDWGSGKTSLMRMAGTQIGGHDGFVTVPFSPWRYEGHDDVKTALMTAILRRLADIAKQDPTEWERLKGTFTDLVKDLLALRRFAPAVAGAAALTTGLPLEVGAAIGAAVAVGTSGQGGDAADEQEADPAEYLESVAEFRRHFSGLLRDMPDLKAVVVFIDDLDRCLPETTVATFEAIRLFLHVKKTAFVIAAHPQIVQAAVDARYAEVEDEGGNLGRDYLEKIIQVSVTVPPLSEPEVEGYINLLFAELYLTSDQLSELRRAADARRADNLLAVAMDYATASEALEGPVPPELEQAFGLANRIAPILARGLRGNPRQVKRFLNSLLLRKRTADMRGVELDPAVLAKLMILELSLVDFERLFKWQLAGDGAPPELEQAEAIGRNGEEPEEADGAVTDWAQKPNVAEWLQLEPALAGMALGPYFFFSRDRLSPAAPATRLSTVHQGLLERLQGIVDAQRRAALDEAVVLEEPEALFAALLERMVRDPQSPALKSALEWASKAPDRVAAFAEALRRVPPASVPISLPPSISVAFPTVPGELTVVLDEWEQNGPGPLQAAVAEARG